MLQLTTANSANACAICTQQCRGGSGIGRAVCEASCYASYSIRGCPPIRKKSIGPAPSSAAGTITISPTNTNIGADIKEDIQYPANDIDSPIAPPGTLVIPRELSKPTSDTTIRDESESGLDQYRVQKKDGSYKMMKKSKVIKKCEKRKGFYKSNQALCIKIGA